MNNANKGCSGTCLLGHERDVKVRYVNGWMNETGTYNTFRHFFSSPPLFPPHPTLLHHIQSRPQFYMSATPTVILGKRYPAGFSFETGVKIFGITAKMRMGKRGEEKRGEEKRRGERTYPVYLYIA